MKNIDKIRQMTLDEFAELLNIHGHCGEFCAYNKDDDCTNKYCIDGRKQWLEQEAED